MDKNCVKCGIIKPMTGFRQGRNVCRKCGSEEVRQWKKANPDKHARTNAEWKSRNPDKVKAHAAVQMALSVGRLVKQPCEKCGNSESQAHHDDYSKPLDVKWFCMLCHVGHHHGH